MGKEYSVDGPDKIQPLSRSHCPIHGDPDLELTDPGGLEH